MRALCSVRPLGGDTRALGAGTRLLSLRVPSQHQPLHFVVEAKARVRELRAQANAHAQLQGMTDTDLFGLAVMQNGEYWFVDAESKLSKYAPKSWRSSHTHGLDANGKPLLELHLVVQFHVESPLLIDDAYSRHIYFLQLKSNVRTRDALPAEVLLLLTGLALQAEYGDSDTYEDRDYFNVEDYAPTSLTGDWVSAAMRACHREHRGLSKVDAEIRFIREVCLLPDTINSHRYRLKQSKTEPEPGTVWLLVTAKGIKILPNNGPVSTFIWSAIGKLSFDRKKFEIRTEEGKITLYSASDDKCKYLFALCKETHQFSMKVASKLNEVLLKEEEQRKICYGYAKTLSVQYGQNKSEQRISVISTTSSTTTSGIVSDRVQSEDELEIMIDTPPAPSTESLAFAHLLDCSNSYLVGRPSKDKQPLTKTSSLQLTKAQHKERLGKSTSSSPKSKTKKSENSTDTSNLPETLVEDSVSLPDQSILDDSNDSPTSMSNKFKCTGSQCSSSCSTVVMARAGLSTLSRASDTSSLNAAFSHTAQNSLMSDNSIVGIDVEYSQDTASALYDGLGQPATIAASSESGVYTMTSSETTAQSKIDSINDDSTTEYTDSHYGEYKPSNENDLAEIDSVSSILNSKAERSNANAVRMTPSLLKMSSDCIDGATGFQGEPKEDCFRGRTNSSVSAASFHGDGSDPTDTKHNLLSASELSDLIVGRGVYPKMQSVSDTLDSESDYVRLPLPFSGDSFIPGHEDTAPSDDNNPEGSFFDRPPTPPTRTDSRKVLNLSLPNILDLDDEIHMAPIFPNKPPPPYEFNHRTLSTVVSPPMKLPPAYPSGASTSAVKHIAEEEVTARVVTSKPMITILKAEAGEVGTSSERTFASPMVIEHRFQKSKRHQASSRRADRSKLAQGIINHNLSPSRELPPHRIDSSVLVAMMKLPPPPPPRRARLPPPPPVSRLPPPPPPHGSVFHQQLYSDVDYVYYPMQDPAVSQQNYLDYRLTESRVSNMHKNGLQYRSTPYLSTTLSTSSMYGSIQNLSDSYVQLPCKRTSLYSLNSRTSSMSNSMHMERLPIPTKLEASHFGRAKSDENILDSSAPPMRTRRMPPPPPPPYEHKKKLPTYLRDPKLSCSKSVETVNSDPSAKKDANCDLDIKTLREKSKNLDLPLISALCNDRSLLKQTKAFVPRSRQAGSDCESEKKANAKSVTTDNVDIKSKQESNVKQGMQETSSRKILMRNPKDKLPALPVSEPHTPRAMSNTYVMHPRVPSTKRVHPSS